MKRFRIQSARKLRTSLQDMERRLWRHLWRIPLEGTHFRRQAPIGPYCPDFASHRLRIVIEIDGFHHGSSAQQIHDRKRDAWLRAQGYRVLRFWTHDINYELDSVLDTIYSAVEDARSHLPLDGGGRAKGAGGGVRN
ncbi:hypothetical protein CSC94_11160 [Zhengella mangrovi]|uniref:DUF559 domain-containing protein n=1 Tax=Zhengella mangrovi TaxID=1982044 RepID=A0A2G1QNP5_9HYPH|nr:DUF559 domain-containing protein [Zhengella mangrovi]PHP67099.1 hypothetical protein CSC94_11160 [Zhengella mangrovi]